MLKKILTITGSSISRSRNALRWCGCMNNSAQKKNTWFLFIFFFLHGLRLCVPQQVKNRNLANSNQAYICIVGHMLPCSCSFLSAHISFTMYIYIVGPPMMYRRTACFWRFKCCRYNCHLSSIHLSACLPWCCCSSWCWCHSCQVLRMGLPSFPADVRDLNVWAANQKTVDEKLIFYGYELLPAIICQSSGDKKSFRSFVGDFKSWKETPNSVVKCMMGAINIKHFSNSRRKRRHVKGEVAKLQWDCVKKLPNTINKHKQKARRCVTESHCETALPDVECLNWNNTAEWRNIGLEWILCTRR